MYCCYQSCYRNLNVLKADVPATALAKGEKLRTANLVIGRLIIIIIIIIIMIIIYCNWVVTRWQWLFYI